MKNHLSNNLSGRIKPAGSPGTQLKWLCDETEGLICQGYSVGVFVNRTETLLALKRGLDPLSPIIITSICFGISFSHLRRVTELKSHANHFFVL